MSASNVSCTNSIFHFNIKLSLHLEYGFTLAGTLDEEFTYTNRTLIT